MRSTETRALIPFEGVQSIDGHHLNRYLRYKGLVPERLLPPHIDLSLYTNVFNNLYANSQGAYVVPEEVRQKYFAEIDARGEPTHEVIRMIREQAISDINQIFYYPNCHLHYLLKQSIYHSRFYLFF